MGAACSEASSPSTELLSGASPAVVNDLCSVVKVIDEAGEVADGEAMKAAYVDLAEKSRAASGVGDFASLVQYAVDQMAEMSKVQAGTSEASDRETLILGTRIRVASDRLELACIERSFPGIGP